jgi:hypothetical protein
MVSEKFASLRQLLDIIQFQSSLLDGSVGKDALVELDPAESLTSALTAEGATYSDLKSFVQELKHAKSDGQQPLLSQDALVHLGVVLWTVSRKVVRAYSVFSTVQPGAGLMRTSSGHHEYIANVSRIHRLQLMKDRAVSLSPAPSGRERAGAALL